MALIVDPAGNEIEVLRRHVAFDGMDVLDIGCGEGRTACRIGSTAASVLGVDPDGERISRARGAAADLGHGGRLEFREADAVALELPDAGFDAVVFTRSL